MRVVIVFVLLESTVCPAVGNVKLVTICRAETSALCGRPRGRTAKPAHFEIEPATEFAPARACLGGAQVCKPDESQKSRCYRRACPAGAIFGTSPRGTSETSLRPDEPGGGEGKRCDGRFWFPNFAPAGQAHRWRARKVGRESPREPSELRWQAREHSTQESARRTACPQRPMQRPFAAPRLPAWIPSSRGAPEDWRPTFLDSHTPLSQTDCPSTGSGGGAGVRGSRGGRRG